MRMAHPKIHNQNCCCCRLLYLRRNLYLHRCDIAIHACDMQGFALAPCHGGCSVAERLPGGMEKNRGEKPWIEFVGTCTLARITRNPPGTAAALLFDPFAFCFLRLACFPDSLPRTETSLSLVSLRLQGFCF